ncbi:2-methoxy-6-polyprenyl-1,4-benzoquinol methylase, mitochondrial-like [Eriocheir sinensis]|uniref:2-methoxy-6-polyprenyl-1,4-benzoquinol methylase, mitochondrial-like n=1 Tax=Eriocheir sinensis TaxID=95602 RepID=UPI0021C8FB4D|nr:2-methoxy-6-polyprenyl-1,4-benzoquinol methylase, mitochondrial-like [Eriocheir sinensis]XP_050729115.1 2-methoxy-6-polyprenyl-1,4-benzoquinol methylase, mitochondrial-like [Eriocheir sinensis]
MSWLAACRLLHVGARVASRELRCASTASGRGRGEYSAEKETHFGFENVSEEEKAQKVHKVFENVASKYDLMNDLMSGGIHRAWKDCFVSRLHPRPNTKLLDVAGGTGDIVFRYVQHLRHARGKRGTGAAAASPQDTTTTTTDTTTSSDSDNSRPLYEISVCDISENMLSVGRHRAEALGYRGIDWVCGDAQNLPFEDDEFDCYTIAFGIRNVVDVQKALDEAYRVLKPGGRFMCLEFSYVSNPAVRWVYDQYSFNVIPAMGQVVAGDWASYQYLVQSIRKFPDQDTFKEMIEDSGFRNVTYENMTFGVAAIHSGFKI